MNFTIDGDFGSIGFKVMGFKISEIPADTAHFLFDKIALKYPELALSNLGLFQLGSVGRKKKGKSMSFDNPLSIFYNHVKTDVLGIVRGLYQLTLLILHYALLNTWVNSVQMFLGDCLETIFGEGRKVHDFLGLLKGKNL